MSAFRDPYDAYNFQQGDTPFRELAAAGVRSVLEYSEIDQTGVRDCRDIFNQAFTDAIANNYVVHIPGGQYRISGPTTWSDQCPRISGAGFRSVIIADDDDFDWLELGNGTVQNVGPTGFVHNLRLTSAAGVNAPPGTTAALRMNGVVGVEVRNVWAQFAAIGFALVNNNYLSSFYNCRTWDQECGNGLYLEGATPDVTEGAGNDISFYNCWFHGQQSGIFAEGNQGFYHFFGGQVAGGIGATDSDDRGSCVTSGSSLAAPTTGRGTVGLNFNGVTFERAHNGWTFRHFGAGTQPSGLSLVCTMCSFFGGTNAHGILKLTGGYDDSLSFLNCAINGEFTQSHPLSIAGAGGESRPTYFEVGTRGNPSFNGVSRHMGSRPMFWGLGSSVTNDSLFHGHNGTLLFFTPEQKILVSFDGGATFTQRLSVENDA